MRIAVGGDHAGFPMKAPVVDLLQSWGHEVTDHGTNSTEPVDFPDIARLVCGDVKAGRVERGIMVCGTGVGAAIAANKIPGIRASLSHDTYSAHQGVEHDDVNVICLGAQIIGLNLAEEIMRAFLGAKFSTEDHFRRRVEKLSELERDAARELG
jgi:ribose 5-phosphate isomerase B